MARRRSCVNALCTRSTMCDQNKKIKLIYIWQNMLQNVLLFSVKCATWVPLVPGHYSYQGNTGMWYTFITLTRYPVTTLIRYPVTRLTGTPLYLITIITWYLVIPGAKYCSSPGTRYDSVVHKYPYLTGCTRYPSPGG